MSIKNISWNNNTFWFYIIIIVVACICATSKKVLRFKNIKCSVFIFFVGLILILIKVFNSTGRDIGEGGGYQWNFNTAISLSNIGDQSLEFGFKLLMVVVRRFTSKFNVFLIICGIIYVMPILYMFNKYKDNLDLFSSTLLYFSVFFFSSFSPIRQAMAASLGLLAYDAMLEKKSIKSLMWLAIASQIHRAAIVLFLPCIFVFFRAFNRKLIIVAIIIFFCTIWAEKSTIFYLFSKSSRYYIYVNSETGIGFEQITYFAPIIFLVIYCRKYVNSYKLKINYTYVFLAFCFGMLGYIITIFGRFYSIFLPLIFIVGNNVKIVKKEHPKCKTIINISMIAYCALRFWLYISQYYNMEDLMPYTNILGWKI